MKLLILALLLISQTCFGQEFLFTYNLIEDGRVKSLKFKTETDSWREAKDLGSTFCFNFFANQKSFDEDRLLRVIDTCANPSEIKQ